MREYTFKFELSDGDLFTFSEEFADEPELERRYVHRMEVLGDGTVTMLCECLGPPAAVERALGDAERVIDIIATGDETSFFYVHFEPEPMARRMIEGRRKTSLTLNMPIELRPDGSVLGRYIGDQSEFGEAFDLVPDDIDIELVRTRSDISGRANPAAGLTARQREVLCVAIDEGYYSVPRRATQADLASELDISTATVGEHLRKVEAEILGSLSV